MGIWNQTFDDLRKPYLEGKDQEKKSKRWQDDDGDGKWYEKSDVDGKISDREKKEKKKNSKKNEAYTVTNADKKGNTKAYQGFVAGMKSKVTGKPMYKAADHMKTEHHSKDCDDTCEPKCEHDQEVKEDVELIDERGRDDSTTLGDNALSKAKRLGQKRRNSKEYKSGLRRGTGAKEYDNYKLARKQHSNDASSENQMSRSKPQRGEGNKAKRRAGQKVRNTRNDRVVSTRDGFKVVRGEHLDWRADLGYLTEKSECDSGDKKVKKQKRESTSS